MAEETTATTQTSGAETATTTLLTGSENETQTETVAAAATEQTATADADAAAATEETKADADAKAVVPAKYEFVMPEGVTLDAEAAQAFEPIARELKLSNEQAQKLVTLQAESVQRSQKAQAEAWANQQKTWQNEVKSDKEIGGANLDATLNAAKAVLKRYGTPDMVTTLDSTGMGNHPQFIRLLATIGKAMAEDTFSTSTSTAGKRSPEEVLWPSAS